jgi:hypothetical protein
MWIGLMLTRVPVLTEGLDMGEELWLDGYLGFEHRLDLLCRLQAFVNWLWRFVESQVGWSIARAQESLVLSGAVNTVVYYPRGAYPDGILTLKMEAVCYSRISVWLPTKPRTLSFNVLIKVNVISLTQVATCLTHACTCIQF